MDNYDFIERRIRFLRWVFSKEEPWRKFVKLGKTIADNFNNNLKETLTNTTFDSYINSTANVFGGYSSVSIDSILPAKQKGLQNFKTANASASVNNSIIYNVI